MASVQPVPADLTLNKYSLEYTFEELERATSGFDPSRKLGSGGFGAVYRGEQSDGTDVAIKVLDMPEEAGFEEEVRVLSKFRHPNLVILMGFARRDSQRILIYELLGGGDVLKRLEKSNAEGVPFTWRERVSAAFDAACGLSHLHNSSPKVFHRDIKSPNILLDRNGTAKMADFGLACLTHGKAHKVDNAAGTVGYACPLYAKRCMVTEGSEAYSFGIVVFELLTASPPAWILRRPDGTEKYEFLAGHINGDADIAMSLADTGAHWPQHVGYALVELALQCTQMCDEQRPRFVNIVNSLRKLRDAPDVCPPHEPLAAKHLQVGAQSPRVAQGRHPHAAFQQCGVQPAAQTPIELPKLWSLNCEFVDGIESLDAIPPEHRTLVHRQEPGGPLLTLLKVGRRAQEDFFQAVFGDSGTRNAVSREHFQIWAVPAADGPVPKDPATGSVPCSFFLANLSRTWTMVNDTLLDSCGKCVQLHGGDCITLGRQGATAEGVHYSTILRLSFDLTGSVLYDADTQEVLRAQPEPDAVFAPPVALAPMPPVAAGALKGTSLVGDVEPRFLLEVGGSGVLEKVEGPRRVIAHGPPAQACKERTGMFVPLVLGSAHAASFWQRLLTQEALSLLASEHVAFEAVRVQDQEKEPLHIAVRNCSSERPVLLRSGAERGALDRPHALEPSERRLLRHGDTVVLVAAQRCSVWLRFLDLVMLKPLGAAGGA